MGLYCFQDLQDSQNNGYERPDSNRHGITRALLRGMWLPITPRSSVDLSTTYHLRIALSSALGTAGAFAALGALGAAAATF